LAAQIPDAARNLRAEWPGEYAHFLVDPAQIAVQLEQDPAIAHASVEVGWPPNQVQISITEREPALIWEQSGVRVWVDVRGRVMALRQDVAGLVRVVVQKPSKNVHLGPCPLQGMDEVLGPGSCVDADIVAGALQFKGALSRCERDRV